MNKQSFRNQKIKRIIAFMLSMVMCFGNCSSMITYAEEGINAVSSEAEQTTEAQPATEAPTPATEAPATEAPQPATEAPVTEAPKPATETPAAEAPKPATEAPATEAPKPATEAPATEAVTTEAPQPSEETQPVAEAQQITEAQPAAETDTEKDTAEETEPQTAEMKESETEETELSYGYTSNDGTAVELHAEKGVFPAETKVTVKAVSKEDAQEILDAGFEKANSTYGTVDAAMFDITFTDKDGKKVQPNGKVTIQIKNVNLDIEGYEEYVSYKMYRVNDDGTLKNLDGSMDLNTKTAKFENDHFTNVAVAAVADLEEIVSDTPMTLGSEIDLIQNVTSQSFKVKYGTNDYTEYTQIPPEAEIHVGDEVWAQFKYADLTNVTPDNIYYFAIPAGLTPLTGSSNEGDIKDEGGNVIGRYWVEDGKIKLQFDNLSSADNTVKSGYVNFYAALNNDAVTNNGDIKLNGTVIGHVNIVADEEVANVKVLKWNGGIYAGVLTNNTLNFDAANHLVKYSICARAPEDNTTAIKDLNVVDTLTVDPASALKGSDYQDISISTKPENEINNINASFTKGSDGKYVLHASNVKPGTEVYVTYYVPVNEDTFKADFKNEAELVTNDQVKLPSSDSVTGNINTTLQINKSSATPQFNTETGETTVTYKVKVTAPSSNSVDIANAYVEDTFTTGGDAVKSVSTVTSTTDGVTGGGSLETINGVPGFKVQLGTMKPGQTIEYTYVATLDTKKCYFPEKPSDKELKNTATAKNNDNTFDKAEAKNVFSRENTVKKGAYDPTKGLFKYTVTFNGMLPGATDETNASSYYNGALKSFDDIITTNGFTFAGSPAPHLEAYRGDSVLAEADITKDENGEDIAGKSNVSVPIPSNMKGQYSYRLTYYVKAPAGYVYVDGATVENTFKSVTDGMIGTGNPESNNLVFTTDSSISAATSVNLNLSKATDGKVEGVAGEDGYAVQGYKIEITSPISKDAEVKDWVTVDNGGLATVKFPIAFLKDNLNIKIGTTELVAGTDYKLEEVTDPEGSFKITFLKDFPQVNDSNNKITISYKGQVVATDTGKTVGAEANGLKNNQTSRSIKNHAELSMGGGLTSGEKTAVINPTAKIEKKASRAAIMGYQPAANEFAWDISISAGYYNMFGEGNHTLVDELPDYLEAVTVYSYSTSGDIGMDIILSDANKVPQGGSGSGTYWTTEGNKVIIHNAVATNAPNQDMTYRIYTRVKPGAVLTDNAGNKISPDNYENLTVENKAYYEAIGAKWYASDSQSVSYKRNEKSASYSGGTLIFTLDINRDGADLDATKDTITIHDTMNKELSLKPETLRINGEPIDPATLTYKEGSNTFDLVIPDGKYCKITYEANIDAEVGEKGWASNTAEIEGRVGTVSFENREWSRAELGAGVTLEKSFYLKKTDENDELLPGASFTLTKVELKNGTITKVGDPIESVDGTDGTYKLKGAGIDDTAVYVLEETAAPDGYEKDGKVHYIAFKTVSADLKNAIAKDGNATLTETAHTGGGNNVDTMFQVVNKVKTADIDVGVTKTWDDNDNQDGKRPTSEIKVQLYKTVGNTTEKVGDSVTLVEKDNKLSYTFTGLPAEEGNQTITYSVKELKADGSDVVGTDNKFNNDYTVSYSGDMATGLVIKNSHTPETSISGEKIWDDANNQDGLRPTQITVQLMKKVGDTNPTPVLTTDGTGTVTQVVTEDENGKWIYKFENLPAKEDGKDITYSVIEVPNADTDGDGELEPELAAVEAEVIPGYTVSYEGNNIKNTHTPETTSVKATKIWSDNNNQDRVRPENITLTLYADGVATTTTATLDARNKVGDDANTWEYTFTNLQKYKTKEAGHEADPSVEIEYTVQEADPGSGYIATYSNKNLTVTNSYEPGKKDVSVEKIWDDANNQDDKRPESITVTLYADGQATDKTVTLNAANSWKASFKDLDEKQNGNAIKYTVSEEQVTNYEAPVIAYTDNTNNADGPHYVYTITNKYTPETTSVKATKIWSDNNNQDGVRPANITLTLYADGVATTKTATLTVANKKGDDANTWEYTFTDLQKYKTKETGHEADPRVEIKYTVQEADPGSGYTASYQNNGLTVKNSYTPREAGEVKGTKTWADTGNADGLRPDSITVQLYKQVGNAAPVKVGGKTQVVNAESGAGWEYSFTGLPAREDGQDITYSVKELAKDGSDIGTDNKFSDDYTVSYDGNNITNTHVPEKTEVTVTKEWVDNNNQDGVRPETVKVQLKADGNAQGDPVEISADGNGNWSYTFTDLQKNRFDGDANVSVGIVYTVEEVDTDNNYIATVEGYTITNTHEIEKTEVSVTKEWDDASNQDGVRPQEIVLNLLADGQPTGVTKTIDAAYADTADENKWSYTFTDLDVYKAGETGQKIKYSVTENDVDLYSADVTGDAANGYTIKNSYTPGKKNVSVEKIWIDNTDQDGFRPESVTIKLFADGVDTNKTVTLNEGNNWTDTFKDLDEKMAGQVIKYTVAEDTVDEYKEPVIAFTDNMDNADAPHYSYTVTNEHEILKTSVTVSKVWEDRDNKEGKRDPYNENGVTINLIANGDTENPVQSVTVMPDENGDWSYTFTDLDQRKAGQDIVYTVEEVQTDEEKAVYEAIITETQAGYTITNKELTRNVFISKTDDNGNALAGASVEIWEKDAAEAMIGWETTADKYEIQLKPGDYILKETKAPAGYDEADDIEFTVNEDGTVKIGEEDGAGEDKNIVTMVDKFTENPVKISKVDIAGTELPGAEIEITGTEASGKDIAPITWTSTDTPKDITLPMGEYTFKEVNAPAGFKAITEVKFIVDAEGKVTVAEAYSNTAKVSGEDANVVTFTDELTEVSIDKVDIADGKELAGAHIQILYKDQDGKEQIFTEWDSDGTVHKVSGLTTEVEYTLRETVAPWGYALTSDTAFMLTKAGEIDQAHTTTTVKDGVLLVEDTALKTGGMITVKKLVQMDGKDTAVDFDFYTALFADKALTKRVSDVKTIKVRASSSGTVEFEHLTYETYYVAETDVDGNPISSDPDMFIVSNSISNSEIQLTAQNPKGSSVITNQMSPELPKQFYKKGAISVSKKVVTDNGEAKKVTDKFYFILSSDETTQNRVSEIKELVLSDESEGSLSFEELAYGEYYLIETDKDGNPLDDQFGYEVEGNVQKVVIDENTTHRTVTVTNVVKSTTTKTPATPSKEKPKNPQGTPKTGDETPLMLYVWMLIGAAVIMMTVILVRHRSRNSQSRN